MKPPIATLLTLCLIGAGAAPAASGPAQAAGDANQLRLTAQAMGAPRMIRLEYSGSGSSYTYDLDDEEGEPVRHYTRVRDYAETVDYSGPVATVDVTRRPEGATTDETERLRFDPASAWNDQVYLWLNPQAFLRLALEATNPRIEVVEDLGIEYTAVTIQTPDGHTLTGYLNADYELRRIRTEVEDPDLGAGTLEASFMDYEQLEGFRFPGVIVHKQDGLLKRVLVVREVTAELAPPQG